MRFFYFMIVAIGIWGNELKADELSVSANPSECITARKGDSCKMSLNLFYNVLQQTRYCLTLASESLGCWSADELPETIEVKLDTTSILVLSDSKGKNRASIELNLRYREASTHRRRVRNPWSVF